MIDQPDHVFAVIGSAKTNVTIRSGAVVVARHRAAAFRADVENGVKRRPQRPRENADVEGLPFRRLEDKVINIAGLFDHAVERHWRGERRGLGVVVVRLGLDCVSKRAEAEDVGIGGDPLIVLGAQAKVAIRGRRESDIRGLLAGDVADPTHRDRLAELTAAGNRRGRTREVADVQAVETRAVAGVGALANLDHISSILGSDHRGEAVLPDERGVVARCEFKSLGVHDRDVRIEQGHAQPDPLDLGADAIPLFGLDREVVDILIVGDAVDRDPGFDRLRLGEVVVRLDLGQFLESPDAEGPQLADAGRGPNADVMEAKQSVGRDLQDGFDMAIVDHLKLYGRDAWLVVNDLLGVGEPGTGEIHLKLGAALAAKRANTTQARRGAKSR